MTAAPLHHREARALGSPLRLTIAGDPAAGLVDGAWDDVRDEFAGVDRAMSRFRADSELTGLHGRGGRAPALSPRLHRALVASERARRVTGGRFDPRILRSLERLGSPAPTQPWGGGGEDAADPGCPVVWRTERRGPLVLGAPVDLGGIGKGLALRWAASRVARWLEGDGVTGFLLDAGGDLVAAGTAGDEPWALGIEDPGDGGTPVAAVRMVPGWALATSSIRLARWTSPDGRAVHHLIDPRTGDAAETGLRAVTVAGPDPAWAEIWSKALFVEGADGIAALARSRGIAAWWIDDGGELSMTAGARAMTFWVRAEAAAEAATAAAASD